METFSWRRLTRVTWSMNTIHSDSMLTSTVRRRPRCISSACSRRRKTSLELYLRGTRPPPPDRTAVFKCKVDGQPAECVRYSVSEVFSRTDIKQLNGIAGYRNADGKWAGVICESVEKGAANTLPYPCSVLLAIAP